MLGRAALRASRPSGFASISVHHNLPRMPAHLRTYASKPTRKPPPPLPSSSSASGARRPPPPSRQTPPTSTTPLARQTSPGTSIPAGDRTSPKDGIQQGAKAAAATGAAAIGATHVKSPVEGARPVGNAAHNESPLPNEPHEPIAQKTDADQPVPGSARQKAHDAQAAAENTEQPETVQAHQLPDLRQGIPSTFDFEFGGASKKQQQERDEAQDDNFDLTTPDPAQNRQRSERDYDASAYETSTDRRRNQMANYLYVMITLGISLGGFYLARPLSNLEELPAGLPEEKATSWSPSAMYARVLARFGNQLGYYTEPSFPKLLPDIPDAQRQPYTLVLSLEDVLIHSSWDRQNGYRVAKRPGMDYFIRYLSQYYELVLFTSTPVAMADPIIKKLDPFHFMWPLGREATKYESGEYVKDLSYLNRPLAKTLIIDTSGSHVKNQPENAIILPKWEGDMKDPHGKDLVALIPFLEYIATMGTEDVRTVLKSFEGQHIPEEFARREGEARKRFLAQLEQQKSSRRSGALGSLAGGLGLKPSPAMGGGMVLADGSSVAEGLAKGKMLSDQIREQGQKQYEALEKQIQENGAQWLKEEEEAQKAAMESQMKDMKRGAFGLFGGGKGE